MTAQEHPEPTEPPAFMTSDGDVYCLVHATTGCTEPWCWRCGSHQMDDLYRCDDPRCRATNTSVARIVIDNLRARFALGPIPIELIAHEIALAYSGGPSSLPVGDAERVGPSEPDALRDRAR